MHCGLPNVGGFSSFLCARHCISVPKLFFRDLDLSQSSVLRVLVLFVLVTG